MREQFRKFHAALAVLAEAEARPHQPRGFFLDKSEPDLFEQGLGHRLPVLFGQRRLGVEKIDMAGGSGHENEDAILCTRCEMCSRCGSSRNVRSKHAVLVQGGTQADGSQPTGCGGQKFPAGQQCGRGGVC